MKTVDEIEARIQHLQARMKELSALRDRVSEPDEWRSVNSQMTALVHQINSLKWVLES